MRLRAALGPILAANVLAGGATYAEEASGGVGQTLSLPYAFFNENFGFAGAYLYGRTGYPQPQSSLIATVMGGSEGAAMGFVAGQNLRLPGPDHMGLDRLFVDPVASIGYFSDVDTYIDGDPNFTGDRAGSNDSDKDNFVTGEGWDNFFRLKFKYLLPIGHGREQIIPRYEVSDGMLASGATGGTSLNPVESGRTFIELRPFYRALEVEGDEIEADLKTNGLDIGLFFDNRDFAPNPTAGHALLLKASRDFGLLNSSDSWTVLHTELDKYISLGATQRFRQRVLAFDFWTAYSPTWEVTDSGKIDNRPPAYAGATLGGLWRMRAFPSQRFSDKAAIYYSAELRLIPEWNPFDRWPGLQKHIGVEWLQFVPFAEFGRVAPTWNIEELHTDMKWDLGLSVRAWAKGFVVRVDSAFSEEGAGVQMMISHPFQF